ETTTGQTVGARGKSTRRQDAVRIRVKALAQVTSGEALAEAAVEAAAIEASAHATTANQTAPKTVRRVRGARGRPVSRIRETISSLWRRGKTGGSTGSDLMNRQRGSLLLLHRGGQRSSQGTGAWGAWPRQAREDGLVSVGVAIEKGSLQTTWRWLLRLL